MQKAPTAVVFLLLLEKLKIQEKIAKGSNSGSVPTFAGKIFKKLNKYKDVLPMNVKKKDTSRVVEKRHYILDRNLSTYFTIIGIS